MGAQVTKCTNPECNNVYNSNQTNCSNCNRVNQKYIDYNIPLDKNIYLTMKNRFIEEKIPEKYKSIINDRLDDHMHSEILKSAISVYRVIDTRAGTPGRTLPITLEALTDILVKIYKRYYNVYTRGLFPPGMIRVNPDTNYQNYRNRMILVMRNFDEITDLDA